jgi:N-carbamoylputrescine amidase
MKITVCELPDDAQEFEFAWQRLVTHVHAHASQLVLLPEMCFSSWFARRADFDAAAWQAAIAAHDTWLARLGELAPAIVLGSRPVNRGALRHNEGYAWTAQSGYQAAHTKYYLPDEDGFWEARWYQRGDGQFRPVQIGALRLGFVICTDIWFMQRARAYSKQGIHLLANPRATPGVTRDKWIAGGRVAAVVSGAYCLSSNKVSPADEPLHLGGTGWVTGPDGEVLGLTSAEEPFVTVEIDLEKAERAKHTYPRYVKE